MLKKQNGCCMTCFRFVVFLFQFLFEMRDVAGKHDVVNMEMVDAERFQFCSEAGTR